MGRSFPNDPPPLGVTLDRSVRYAICVLLALGFMALVLLFGWWWAGGVYGAALVLYAILPLDYNP